MFMAYDEDEKSYPHGHILDQTFEGWSWMPDFEKEQESGAAELTIMLSELASCGIPRETSNRHFRSGIWSASSTSQREFVWH